jgi:hypothetical protein
MPVHDNSRMSSLKFDTLLCKRETMHTKNGPSIGRRLHSPLNQTILGSRRSGHHPVHAHLLLCLSPHTLATTDSQALCAHSVAACSASIQGEQQPRPSRVFLCQASTPHQPSRQRAITMHHARRDLEEGVPLPFYLCKMSAAPCHTQATGASHDTTP